MKAYTTARLGSNMEFRYMPNGDPVGQVSLAVKLSKKDKSSGEYLTQWISASLFGKRAESLAPYLVKGSLHAFHLRDIHIDEYTKDGVTKSVLRATIDDVELCGNAQKGEKSAGRTEGGLADIDDDIPF